MEKSSFRISLADISSFALGMILIALVGLPYLAAWNTPTGDIHFGGFLLNPLDGNSYLAKMYEGWRGDWRFTLPYTANPGSGVFLFEFYLALGHFARWTGLSLSLTFHLARLSGAILMLLALHRFLRQVLPDRRLLAPAFALAALGSGLGWLALAFNGFTSDFWVAETYPFLSAYANPHFPIGLALLLWLLAPNTSIRGDPVYRILSGIQRLLVCAGAFALGIIAPFGVVIAVAVLGGLAVWDQYECWDENKGPLYQRSLRAVLAIFSPCERLFWVLVGGGAVLVYSYLTILSSSQLSGWNEQNLTPSPPPWDILISLSPALLVALPGILIAWRRRSSGDRLLIVWALLGLVLLYLPLGLQRRFLMGLYIPLVGLAAVGVGRITSVRREAAPSETFPERRVFPPAWIVWALLLLFSLPTNLVVLLAGQQAVQNQEQALYLTPGEKQALDWLSRNASPQSLVLASPDMGLLIPAHTGRRVIYGHPYETVNAEIEKQAVIRFFRSQSQLAFIQEHGVEYVFYGDRERDLGNLAFGTNLQEVYRSGEVILYATVQK